MITIISGTNRADSHSLKIAKHVHGVYQNLGAKTKLLDLMQLPVEIFSPTAYAEKPDSFAPFRESILGSAGLVIVSPEYNGGMPGALKLFIDMLPFPESFEKKPACFVGLAAGLWGGLRPIEHLQQVFGARNAYIYPERVFIPGVNEVLGDDGSIHDQGLINRLHKQAEGFSAFVQKIN